MKKAYGNAPIESKTAAGTITGLVTLVLTWAIFNFVPGVKHAPHDLATSLPGFISVVAGFAAAYMTKHTPRLDEVLQVVLEQLGKLGHVPGAMGSAMAASQAAAAVEIPAGTMAPGDAYRMSTSGVISAGDLGVIDTQPDPYASSSEYAGMFGS